MKKVMGTSDRLFYALVYMIAVIAFVATLYPFIYILSISMSGLDAIQRGKIWLIPIGLDFSGYLEVVKNPKLWTAYGNTIFYVVFGTILNMVMTVIGAYPLSRKSFGLRRFLNFFIAFTMYFSGGFIPTYLLITGMGLYNSRLVMLLPVAVSTFNIMICRSAFSGIPEEVFESASMDGANDFQVLWHLFIRLIGPTLAVLTLYYAVGHWNTYFNALLYLGKQELQPLQVLLRRVLIQASQELTPETISSVRFQKKAIISIQIRYVTIIVTTLPILLIYPFLQRYFVKGVMLGAVKG
jgi:putative aldouronate transport system permease protein